MGDWTLAGKASRVTRLAYVAVDTGAGANTKTAAWTTIQAATPYRSRLDIASTLYNPSDALIDIAMGDAGSEVIIVNNLYGHMLTTSHYAEATYYSLPIMVPAGVRLSAKAQTKYAGTSTISLSGVFSEVSMFGADSGLAICTTLGAVTADSGGTQIDPGASVNTKGAWVELSSSLPHDVKSVIVCFGGMYNTIRSTCGWSVDVGIGAEGSEVVVMADITLLCNATSDSVNPQNTPPIGLQIPKGTRVAVRASCDDDDATDRLFDVILYVFG